MRSTAGKLLGSMERTTSMEVSACTVPYPSMSFSIHGNGFGVNDVGQHQLQKRRNLLNQDITTRGLARLVRKRIGYMESCIDRSCGLAAV